MDPLRAQWAALKSEIETHLRTHNAKPPQALHSPQAQGLPEAQGLQSLGFAHEKIATFLAALSSLKILDPACGSGNFLYVAIQQLLDLEKEIINFAAMLPAPLRLLPRVRPTQLLGIEINRYASELAQVSIWIGFLQWMHANGQSITDVPILANIKSIENRDAILDFSDDKKLATPAQWPDAHFIVGNPPFLHPNRYIEKGMTQSYIASLYSVYKGSILGTSDLCCYWFELARRKIEAAKSDNILGSPISGLALPRCGLLATQGIRGSDSRKVIERIQETGGIFAAWADREWVLDGAMVHTSMVAFDNGSELKRNLDGRSVSDIYPNLTSDIDLTLAKSLKQNEGLQCQGDKKGARFEIDFQVARRFLAKPNPNGRPTFDVCRPWANGQKLYDRPDGKWIIDFGTETSQVVVAGYETAFEHVKRMVSTEYSEDAIKQAKMLAASGSQDEEILERSKRKPRKYWWLHERPRPMLRKMLVKLPRFIFTTGHSKHRIFIWLPMPLLPDHSGFAFARDDDYFFGVMHSSSHEMWSSRLGTQLREKESGDRYTPTTGFVTFAFPWLPGKEKTTHPAYKRIAAAAKELNDLRERWLNPPELIEPLARIIDANDKFLDVPEEARTLVRHSAIMAEAAKSPNLKKRTLTNLYNERPTWLRLAHEALDRAVLAAYAAVDPAGGWSEDWAAVWTDTGAGQPLPEGHPLTARRAEIDQKVLANLLRMNHERAAV